MDAAWIKKELQDVNFSGEQATALSHVVSHLATKDDVQSLRQHVDAGFKEIHQTIGQIWWKIAVLMTLQAGLIVTLIELT
jgi:hypothetical protein